MYNIIGGGITGLSLAYYLARAGLKVTVYEASDRLGGNCRSVKLGEDFVDCYYHVLTNTDDSLQNIMKEIGVSSLLYPIRTSMAFHQGNQIYPITNFKQALTFAPLNIIERLMLGVCFLRSRTVRNGQVLDGQLAKDWLCKIGGEKLYNTFWKPIMMHKFGEFTEDIVATDMWFRLNRLFTTSRGRGKNAASYIKGTFKVFFDKLEYYLKNSGVIINKGCSVKKLETENGRVSSIVLENGQKIKTNNVIVTTPLPHFSKLLSKKWGTYKESLARIAYLNNTCLILKTSKPIVNYYQLAITDTDIPFTGIIGAAQFYPPEKFGGYITYVTTYFKCHNELYNKSPHELLNIYIPFLQRIKNDITADDIINFCVVEELGVEAIHSVNYRKILPSTETPIRGLRLLCSAQIYPEPTVLNTACNYAKKLAKQIVYSERTTNPTQNLFQEK